MKLTEKQLKSIIAEEVQKALTGQINVPEFEISKSIKQLVTILDTEAEKFLDKYNTVGDEIYDDYGSRLYAMSEKLERFLKEHKEMESL